MNNSFFKKDDAFNLVFNLSTIYFYFSLLLSIIYLVAPLFGGKLFLFAVFIYSSQAGLAFISKKYLKKVHNKEQISNIERVLIFSYIIISVSLYCYSILSD
jgi:hypothetical protein